MRKVIVLVLLSLIGIAYGSTLDINGTDLSYASTVNGVFNRNYNTYTDIAVLNLTLNASADVNVTNMTITIYGLNTGDISGNITSVFLYKDNETNQYNKTFDSSDILIGSNSTLTNVANTTSYVNVTIRNINEIVGTSPEVWFVVLRINQTATSGTKINVSVSNASTNNISDVVNNYASPSNDITFANLHVTAYLIPRYTDTNVTNQTITYVLSLLSGTDNVNKTSIIVPSNFTVKNVTLVKTGSYQKTIDYSTSCPTSANVQTDHACVEVGQMINVTLPGSGADSSQNNTITIQFTIDTQETPVSGLINSTVEDGIEGVGLVVNSTPESDSNITLNTVNLIEVKNVTSIKNSAFANGNDYWEFNITINITQNVTGLVQMKMNNWSDGNGHTIALTSGATKYALLYRQGSMSNNASVENSYTSDGVSISGKGLFNLILRMVIPSGTPASSTGWYTNFWMLFRTE